MLWSNDKSCIHLKQQLIQTKPIKIKSVYAIPSLQPSATVWSLLDKYQQKKNSCQNPWKPVCGHNGQIKHYTLRYKRIIWFIIINYMYLRVGQFVVANIAVYSSISINIRFIPFVCQSGRFECYSLMEQWWLGCKTKQW